MLRRRCVPWLCAVVLWGACGAEKKASDPDEDLASAAIDLPAFVDLAVAADQTAPSPDLVGVDDPGPGPTESCAVAPDQYGFFTVTASDGIAHVMRLPKKPVAYDTANPAPYPLFVAIHGCGDTTMNWATWGVVPWGDWRDDQDYIALAVGGRDGACWDLGVDPVKVENAIAKARACFYVHQKKIVIGGFSSGGMLAYKMGLGNAAAYAGILIANSGIRAGVGGASKVTPALDAAAWKLPIAQTARAGDDNFPLTDTLADKAKIEAAGFPYDFRQVAGEHGDVDGDWPFLLPHIAGWRAP